MKTWRSLGALHAARMGMSAGEGVEQLQQALSVALQRENARAVLRRLPEGLAPATAAEALEAP